MTNYRMARLVDVIINKTDDFFCVYEEGSGNLVQAYPDGKPLPSHDGRWTDRSDGHVVIYVVTPEHFSRIKAETPDRPLDDIGILVGRPSPGFNHVPIGKIRWAKDPDVRVGFYREPSRCPLPHK